MTCQAHAEDNTHRYAHKLAHINVLIQTHTRTHVRKQARTHTHKHKWYQAYMIFFSVPALYLAWCYFDSVSIMYKCGIRHPQWLIEVSERCIILWGSIAIVFVICGGGDGDSGGELQWRVWIRCDNFFSICRICYEMRCACIRWTKGQGNRVT